MTNVNVNVQRIGSTIGSNGKRYKTGYIDSAAKAAQNDTWTLKNINQLIDVTMCKHDATGAWETHTISDNVITLTSATTGAKSATVIYI
jgi:hypothetical protein